MKRITTIEASSVLLPPDAVDALGVDAGGELDIEIVGVLWLSALSRRHNAHANLSIRLSRFSKDAARLTSS